MTSRLPVRWFALLCCLWLLFLVPMSMAAPEPFARMDLDKPDEFRNMTVSTIEVIDLMDLSQSRVSLLSTTGDGSDTKIIPLPSIQTVTRIFSERVAFCKDYTLTILGPLTSTVSVSGLTEYSVFIHPYLPVVQCQVPGATGDVVMSKINGSNTQPGILGMLTSTDMAYLLQDPRGVLAIQQHPQVIGAYGSWTSADYDPSNLTYTFVHNQFGISDYTLDRGIARSVSNLTPFISGTPPIPGEYLLSAFQYTPVDQKITTYAAWPVVILDGDNRFIFMGKPTPYQYDLMSGEDLVLTFENPTNQNNLSYILIMDDENYDAQVDVNMSALEDSQGGVSPDLILSGNPILMILKNSGPGPSNLESAIRYSITRQGGPTPVRPQHEWQINISPGYGISGYAKNSTYAIIGQDDLKTLEPGSFSVYALALDNKNNVVALDQGGLLVGSVPTISFTAMPAGGQAPLRVQFTDNSTNNPVSWNWNFGDGTANDTRKDPSHLYQDTGTYNVTLTAANPFGSSSMIKQRYISVTAPGFHADFTGLPTTGTDPLFVQFTDTTTGNPVSWSWDFGDGTANDTRKDPVHMYQNTGTYNVTLTASNGSVSSTMQKQYYISITAPVLNADFTGLPTAGTVPLRVRFTDTTTGNPATWDWDFGDGTANDTAQNPSHLYQDTGTYDVTLTASNGSVSSTITKPGFINVTAPGLYADFIGNPASGYYPLQVQFTDTSTGLHDTWTWNFGDGRYSAEQHPSHTYSEVRSYTVSLTVSNATLNDTRIRNSYITLYARGGGGGGGGGGYTFNPVINATPVPTPKRTPVPAGQIQFGPDNRTSQPVVFISPAGIAALSLGTGVAVTGADGRMIMALSLEQVAEGLVPQLPQGYTIVSGFAYAIMPQDAVINPGANLKMTVSGDQWSILPVNDLILVWYDAVTGSWVPLTTTVDAAAPMVSADITKGGMYALVIRGPLPVASTTATVTPTPTIPVTYQTTSPPAGIIPWTIVIPALVATVIVIGAVIFFVFKIRKGKPPGV